MRAQRWRLLPAALLLMATLVSEQGGAVTFPEPVLIDQSAGFLSVTVAHQGFRGSAVIAKDPRLLFSCAHLLFEDGEWATSYTFSRAYHSSFQPQSGVEARGARYFASYANNVSDFGTNDARTFNLDFSVMYGYDAFGPAAGLSADGGPALEDPGAFKFIVGYPAVIDFTGADGEYFQHATPFFQDVAFMIAPAYYLFDDVSTGGGNSGGPVYTLVDDSPELAGILVSGSETTAGVRAIDSSATTMANDALADVIDADASTQIKTYRNTLAFRLPDAATRYNVRSFQVTLHGTLTKLLFSTNISTTYRGDLDVYLRSPSGRVKWISKHRRDAIDNLVRKNADLSASFRGRHSDGKWVLFMRDASRGDRARYNSASLRISAIQ